MARRGGSIALPVAAALGGSALTASFVAVPRGSAVIGQDAALRGAGSQVGSASSSAGEMTAQSSLISLAGAAGAVALMGQMAAGRAAPAPRALRRAAKAAADAPPPPPAWEPSEEVGAMAPLGYFDPAGFTKKDDEAGFKNLRAAEIKHGRVAMMAALGAVVQPLIKFPGFEKVPAGLGAVTTAPGTYGLALLFAVAGALELGVWTESPDKEPGNFGNPAGWGSYDEDMRNKELNNGRFAMFAALGIVAADLLTGKDGIAQLAG